MIDQLSATLAFRNRAISVSAATTGSTSLSATALGFARAAGSFLTDGFQAGMEVVGTGFSAANNAASSGSPPQGGKVIKEVSAQFLTIVGGCTAQSATAGRTLTVGLPIRRVWENIERDASTLSGFPYVSEQFVPATTELKTITAVGGTVEETGLYILTVFGLEKYGAAAIRKYVNALLALYTPGTSLTAGSHTLKVRGDTSTRAGQIIPLGNGWASCQITVPYRAFSINSIAA